MSLYDTGQIKFGFQLFWEPSKAPENGMSIDFGMGVAEDTTAPDAGVTMQATILYWTALP